MNIIIETNDGSEPVEIRVISGEAGSITIDGEEIEDLEDGDRIVIVEDLKDGDTGANYFFSDDGKSFTWSQDHYFDALKKLDTDNYKYKFKQGKNKKKDKDKDSKFKNKDWKRDKKKEKNKDSDQGNIWNMEEGNSMNYLRV